MRQRIVEPSRLKGEPWQYWGVALTPPTLLNIENFERPSKCEVPWYRNFP